VAPAMAVFLPLPMAFMCVWSLCRR
jgi:hypothetical protein